MLFGRLRLEAEAANLLSRPSSALFLPYFQVSSSGRGLSWVSRSRWALAPAGDSACSPAEQGQCVAYHLSEPSLKHVLLALSRTDLRNPCFERECSFLLA